MSGDNRITFEQLLAQSNYQELKAAAEGMHQIYQSFVDAGFSRPEALILLTALMRNEKPGVK